MEEEYKENNAEYLDAGCSCLGNLSESALIHQRKLRRIRSISAFLGWLGALNMLLIASYMLSTYTLLSTVPPVTRLELPVYAGVTIFFASAAMLIYGSTLVWKYTISRGGLVNLFTGSLAPIPTYIYFAFFSQPAFLHWVGPLGLFLFAPAVISGIAGMYASRSTSHSV